MSFVKILPDFNSVPKCTICMNNIEEEFIAHIAHEKEHLFHKDCILEWIQQCLKDGIVPTCPLCRRIIENIDGIEIQDLEPTLEEKQRRFLTVTKHIREIFCPYKFDIKVEDIENKMIWTIFFLKEISKGFEGMVCVGIKKEQINFGYFIPEK